MLIMKDESKDILDNARFKITSEFKILVRVLAKRLALVIKDLVEELQTCAILIRSIHNNLHLMLYTIESVGCKTGTLTNLDQMKAFNKFDPRCSRQLASVPSSEVGSLQCPVTSALW